MNEALEDQLRAQEKRIEKLEEAMRRVSALLDSQLPAGGGSAGASGRFSYGIWPPKE